MFGFGAATTIVGVALTVTNLWTSVSVSDVPSASRGASGVRFEGPFVLSF
jgi:hypothetical protein